MILYVGEGCFIASTMQSNVSRIDKLWLSTHLLPLNVRGTPKVLIEKQPKNFEIFSANQGKHFYKVSKFTFLFMKVTQSHSISHLLALQRSDMYMAVFSNSSWKCISNNFTNTRFPLILNLQRTYSITGM